MPDRPGWKNSSRPRPGSSRIRVWSSRRAEVSGADDDDLGRRLVQHVVGVGVVAEPQAAEPGRLRLVARSDQTRDAHPSLRVDVEQPGQLDCPAVGADDDHAADEAVVAAVVGDPGAERRAPHHEQRPRTRRRPPRRARRGWAAWRRRSTTSTPTPRMPAARVSLESSIQRIAVMRGFHSPSKRIAHEADGGRGERGEHDPAGVEALVTDDRQHGGEGDEDRRARRRAGAPAAAGGVAVPRSVPASGAAAAAACVHCPVHPPVPFDDRGSSFRPRVSTRCGRAPGRG